MRRAATAAPGTGCRGTHERSPGPQDVAVLRGVGEGAPQLDRGHVDRGGHQPEHPDRHAVGRGGLRPEDRRHDQGVQLEGDRGEQRDAGELRAGRQQLLDQGPRDVRPTRTYVLGQRPDHPPGLDPEHHGRGQRHAGDTPPDVMRERCGDRRHRRGAHVGHAEPERRGMRPLVGQLDLLAEVGRQLERSAGEGDERRHVDVDRGHSVCARPRVPGQREGEQAGQDQARDGCARDDRIGGGEDRPGTVRAVLVEAELADQAVRDAEVAQQEQRRRQRQRHEDAVAVDAEEVDEHRCQEQRAQRGAASCGDRRDGRPYERTVAGHPPCRLRHASRVCR